MAEMKKKNKWKWAAALVLGIVLAVLFEGIIALYRVNRGYGNEKTAFLLAAESGNDYVVGENGTLWVKTGIQPYMLFHLKEDLGHVHIRFKEPLAQEMNISCYYAQSDAFHVLQQKNAYLVEGTTEAFFSVPFGNWDSYRLGIDGDFVLESIEGVKSVPLSQIKTEQVLLQANGVRFILFLLLFVCGGLFLAEKREGRKKSRASEGKPRMVYMDGIRVFATFMVIVVHVWGALEKMSVLQEQKGVYFLFLIGQFISISCNPLFFMLSGALLLPWREESFSVFVRKRLAKVILPLLVYGGVYIILLSASQFSVQEWTTVYVLSMLRGNVRMAPHLWMVFELIAMYVLVLPLRSLLKNASEQTEKLLTLFILVLMGVYSVSHYWKIDLAFSTFLNGWTGVFLLGYLMNRSWMRRYDRLWMTGGVLGLVLGVAFSMMAGSSNRYVFGTSIFVLLIACGIYSAFFCLESCLQKCKGILLFLGKYSYSVLLIHWFVLYNVLFIQGMSPLMPKVFFVLLSVSLCSLLSFVFAVFIDHMVIAVLERGISQAAKTIRRLFKRREAVRG